MKTFLTLFLILTSVSASANFDTVYSPVCPRSHTEGTLKKAINGQSFKQCLSIHNLPDIYPVHLLGKCYKTHVPGEVYVNRYGDNVIACINKDALLKEYDSSVVNGCHAEFESDGYEFYNKFGFRTITCKYSDL